MILTKKYLLPDEDEVEEFQSREIRSDDSDTFIGGLIVIGVEVSIPWNPVWWFWQ